MSLQQKNQKKEKYRLANKVYYYSTKAYYAKIRSISAQIKPIRDKLKIAKATLESVPKLEQLLDIERSMEEKIKIKEQKRGISR